MSTPTTFHHFKKGDEIEVLKNDDIPAWFPATIINSPSPTGTLHVKFNTLFNEKDSKDGTRKRKKIRKYIDVNDGVTRPVPSPELHRWFAVGEEVEVFHENGWRKGEVKDVLEDSKYTVVIGGGTVEVVVENWRVRAFRNWKQNVLLQVVSHCCYSNIVIILRNR